MTAATVVVDGLATARLVRLAQRDTITEPFRDRFVEACRVAEMRRPVELLDCPWCLAVWVAAGATALRALTPRLWAVAATTLAAAEIAGLIATRLEAE